MRYKSGSIIRFVYAVLLWPLICGVAVAQHETGLDSLRGQYKLVRAGLFGNQGSDAGTLLVVRKPGIFGVGVHGTANPTATYTEGVLHPPLKTAALLAGGNASGATHWFQVGEPVYPMKFEIEEKSDRISMTIVTANLSHKAVVRFQFARGFLASAQSAQIQSVISEVLTIGNAADFTPRNPPGTLPTSAMAAQTQPGFAMPPASRDGSGAPYQIYVRAGFGAVYPTRVQTQFLVFFPDGTAMGSLPDTGMDGFNPQAYAQRLAQRGPITNLFGRYQVSGNQVDIVWGNFRQSLLLQNDGDAGAVVSGDVLQPVCRCDGARFTGLYAWGQFAIQFSADGTFVDRGAIDTVAGLDPGRPKAGQGVYNIRNNTLYLNFTDGRQAQTSFAAPGVQQGGPTFDWIAIKQKLAYRQN